MKSKTYNTLFVCTGNRARSIMAEALLNHWGKGRFRAFSAGSHPNGEVHPLTIRLLSGRGLAIEHLRSKRWEEFAGPEAPAMDFIITLCDRAAGEVCPIWPGRRLTAHWGVEDPAEAHGETEERVFRRVCSIIEARVKLLVALRPDALDELALEQRLRAIGKIAPPETRGKELE